MVNALNLVVKFIIGIECHQNWMIGKVRTKYSRVGLEVDVFCKFSQPQLIFIALVSFNSQEIKFNSIPESKKLYVNIFLLFPSSYDLK